MPTQEQMFYQAHRKLADVNNDFMWLVQNGMTREDLARNIERRPSLWSRYAGFLDTLPSASAMATVQKDELSVYKANDAAIVSKLSQYTGSEWAALTDAAIDDGYMGEDLGILVEVINQAFPGAPISVFCEEDPEQATAKAVLMLEMRCDLILRAYHCTDAHPLAGNDIAYRVQHYGLTLTVEQMQQIADRMFCLQRSAECIMQHCSQASLDAAIDDCLVWYGHLDGEGDCPVCHRNGWIGAEKHAKCHEQIMAAHDGMCGRCGKEKATDTYNWVAVCDSCKAHEDHLDSLCN